MGLYKPAAFRYIIGVCLTAVVAVVLAVVAGPVPPMGGWLPFAVLTLMAAVSHLFPVRSARETAFYVLATVFVFAAIVLLPMRLLAIHTLTAMLPFTLLHWVKRRPRVWYRWSFNTAQTALAALGTRGFLEAVGWDNSFAGPVAVVLVMAAVVLFTLLQGLLVGIIIHLNNGVRLVETPPLQREALLTEIIMSIIGAVVAALGYAQPWFLFMLPVPLVIVQSLMRRVQMVHLADLDAKTGLYNYRYFEQAMNQEFAMAKRVRRPTVLMFLDLDYLRHINNEYGHLAGDHVLKEVAAVLTRGLRPGDLLARFGGEEFVAMLPGTEPSEAYYVAERMRRAVECHHYRWGEQSIPVTISIGLAGYPVDGEEPADLIRRADAVLYQAKALGRNRVCVACSDSADGAMAPMTAMTAAAAAVAAAMMPAPAACGPTPSRQPEAPSAGPEGKEAPPPADEAARPPEALQPSWFEGTLPAGIGIIGVLTVAWIAARAAWPYPQPGALVLLTLLAVLAEALKVQVYEGGRQGISISLSSGAIMAAITFLDLPGAVAVALTASLAHAAMSRQRDPEKALFNSGNMILATTAAAVLYDKTAGSFGPELSWIHLVGPLVPAAAFYLINTGLVLLVIATRNRQSLPVLLRENLWFGPAIMLCGVTGAYIGTTYSLLGPIGVAIFLAPILVLRYSFSVYARRVQKSIRALETAKAAVEASQTEKERTLDQLIITIAAIIDARDRSVSGHSRQVARYAQAMAEEMALPEDLIGRIRIAALMHDLGKIGIPEAILHKPGRLTADEYAIVKAHAPLGAQILSEVWALQDVARMVGEHHEQWSGVGYPMGKAGEEISMGGRILAVADALDTILSDRPYSRAKPLGWAVEEIQRCAGSQFDPKVVAALLRVVDRQDRSFFVNSARSGEERVRTLFSVVGGKSATQAGD